MTSSTTTSPFALVPSIETAWQDVDSSFERFCPIEQMLCEDAQQLAGAPHSRGGGRFGHRWGRTKGKIGFHGGKVAVHRPRKYELECTDNASIGEAVSAFVSDAALEWAPCHRQN